MASHHVIPRFHLKRWANREGQLEVIDTETWRVSEEDPNQFFAVPDFNRYERADGTNDPWLEQAFLGGLDNDVANLLPQIENLARPRSHLRNARKRGWHLTHILSPKATVRLAMYVAAQAVRSPAWRDAVHIQTASAMRNYVEDRVARELATATDPAETERLRGLQGLRYYVTEISGNHVPHLSAHLSYRMGEVLYGEYSWSVLAIPTPIFMLADDPVLIFNWRHEHLAGSYSQVARARGDALSIYKTNEEIADDAVAAMRGNDLIFFPLDPQRVLMLSSHELMGVPGRHDVPREFGQLVNALARIACKRWICLPPGNLEAARSAIYAVHPWRRRLDEQDAA